MITTGSKIVIEKGCKDRNIAAHKTATVLIVQELGKEYSHQIGVTMAFLDGRKVTFYARHRNRLADPIVNMKDGNPMHSIKVRVKQ